MGLTGLVLMVLLWMGPMHIGQTVLDVHTMLVSSMLVLVGYQAVTIGFAARIFALQQEIGPPSRALRWGFTVLNLERGLVAGAVAILAGFALVGYVVVVWSIHGFGPLDLSRTLRPVLLGTVLVALGMQTLLMSLFYSMLGLSYRRD